MDMDIEIAEPPKELEDIFGTVFSDGFKSFLVKIVRNFGRNVEQIFTERSNRTSLLLGRDQDETLESLAAFIESQFSGDRHLAFSMLLN